MTILPAPHPHKAEGVLNGIEILKSKGTSHLGKVSFAESMAKIPVSVLHHCKPRL